MIVRSINTVFFITGSAILAWSGFTWITEGIGLHPLIAFPSATIAYVIPFWNLAAEAKKYDTRLSDLLLFLEISKETAPKMLQPAECKMIQFYVDALKARFFYDFHADIPTDLK